MAAVAFGILDQVDPLASSNLGRPNRKSLESDVDQAGAIFGMESRAYRSPTTKTMYSMPSILAGVLYPQARSSEGERKFAM